MITKEAVFDEIARERGGVAEIYSAFGDIPNLVKAHFELNKALMLLDDLPISRIEREWLAMETSRANRCRYALAHHKVAYENHAKGKSKNELPSPARLRLLSKLAATLTKHANKTPSLRKEFLKTGFTEAEWLHGIKIVSYFNFTNRLALALNLQLEKDSISTCR